MEEIILTLEDEPKLKHLRVFAGPGEELDVVEPFNLTGCGGCAGQGGSGGGAPCGEKQTCSNSK